MNTNMKNLMNLLLLLITLDLTACGSNQNINEPISTEAEQEKPVTPENQKSSPIVKETKSAETQTELQTPEMLEREQVANNFPINRLRKNKKNEIPTLDYIYNWKPFCDRLAEKFYDAEKFTYRIGSRETTCKDIDRLIVITRDLFNTMHFHPDYSCWIPEVRADLNSGIIGKYTKANIRSRFDMIARSTLEEGRNLGCCMDSFNDFLKNEVRTSLPPPDLYSF